jgi:hypothetical protein
MDTPLPSGNLLQENGLRKLLLDRCPDGKSRSLTAVVLDGLAPPILDVCPDRTDWADHYLSLFGGSLDELQHGFLKAVSSWQRSLVLFGFMETAGMGVSRATKLTEALESGDPGEAAVLNMLRAAPDDSIDRLLEKTRSTPSLQMIVLKEVNRRKRRRRVTAASPFRVNRSETEPNRPHSVAFRYWLRARGGAPALCFWSWTAMDQILFPNSGQALGEASEELVKGLGLVKASDHVRGCHLNGDWLELTVQEAGPVPGKPVESVRMWPATTYRVS